MSKEEFENGNRIWNSNRLVVISFVADCDLVLFIPLPQKIGPSLEIMTHGFFLHLSLDIMTCLLGVIKVEEKTIVDCQRNDIFSGNCYA